MGGVIRKCSEDLDGERPLPRKDMGHREKHLQPVHGLDLESMSVQHGDDLQGPERLAVEILQFCGAFSSALADQVICL